MILRKINSNRDRHEHIELSIFEKKSLERDSNIKLLWCYSDDNGISNKKYDGLKVIVDLIE